MYFLFYFLPFCAFYFNKSFEINILLQLIKIQSLSINVFYPFTFNVLIAL